MTAHDAPVSPAQEAAVVAVAEVLAEHQYDNDFGCPCDNPVGFDDWAAHVAAALLASDALAGVLAGARAEAWDEGYEAAEYMAHCWGHTDSWEDEPTNPYRADAAGEVAGS